MDGCKADLSTMRDYNYRYRICEQHLKALLVEHKGTQQRFCQQCGKFHAIDKFDGSKRSCRARLSKHNARRRREREMANMLRTKGQIDEAALCAKYDLTPVELAKKLSKMQRAQSRKKGTNGSKELSSTVSTNSSSINSIEGNDRNVASLKVSSSDLDLLGENYLDGILGPLGLQLSPEMHAGKQLSTDTSLNSKLNDPVVLNDPNIMDLDDIGVLHELSRELGLDLENGGGFASSDNNGINLGGSISKTGILNLQSQASSCVDVPHSKYFANVTESESNDLQQVMPLQELKESEQDDFSLANVLSSIRSSTPNGYNSYPRKTTVTTGIAPGKSEQSVKESIKDLARSGSMGSHQNNLAPVSALSEALNILQQRHEIGYKPEEHLVRFSLKLFGCSPAQLPQDLKPPLMALLNSNYLEGYLRPGCVHIEVNAMLSSGNNGLDNNGAIYDAVERFIENDAGAAATSNRSAIFQLRDEVAFVKNGMILHTLSTSFAHRLLPSISAVLPLAVNLSGCDTDSIRLQIFGDNFDQDRDRVLVRSRGSFLDARIIGIEHDASRGLKCMSVEVEGPLMPGSLHVEIMRGSYCSAPRTLLATSHEAVVECIRTLENDALPGDLDTFIYELGSVVECYEAENVKRNVWSKVLQSMGSCTDKVTFDSSPVPPSKSARRIIPFVFQRGWTRIADIALEIASLDLPASKVIEILDTAARKTTGMPIISLAVVAKKNSLLKVFLAWAGKHNIPLSSTAAGYRNLTPLHLVALMDDGGAMALAITEACRDALFGWDGARADDGSTPLGFATQYGTCSDIERAIATVQRKHVFLNGMKGNGNEKHASLHAPHVENDSDKTGGEDIWHQCRVGKCNVTDSDFQLYSTAKSMSAASTVLRRTVEVPRLLTFSSSQLETRFAEWYHAGQIPVDIAFMVINVLSQAAWIFKWDMNSSIALTALMMLLMFVNSMYLLAAWLYPLHYIKHRESLCVASMLMHKIIQMFVTVMPGVGTIYSSSYNTTVALLESSSFSQVIMISVGLRPRFSTHLLTLLIMLLLSSSMNGSICNAIFSESLLSNCTVGMFAFQASACFALPCMLVYFLERRSRNVFLRSAE